MSNDPDKLRAIIERFERLLPYRIKLSDSLHFPVTECRLFILLLALKAPDGISVSQVRDAAKQVEMDRFHGTHYGLRYSNRAYQELRQLRDYKVFVRDSDGRGSHYRSPFRLTSSARSALVLALENVECNGDGILQ